MTEEQKELDNMPEIVPKVYLAGTPSVPEGAMTGLNIDDTVLVTVRCKVTKKGKQHQKGGAGPFINLNAVELEDLRPVAGL